MDATKTGTGASTSKTTDGAETRGTAPSEQPTLDSTIGKATEDTAAAGCLAPPNCFVAGTLVHTLDGPKAIETFVGGEQVFSRDELSGEPGLRPVVATTVAQDQPIYEVVIADAQGGRDVLHTTAEHPFWVTNVRAGTADGDDSGTHAQWVRAASLAPGMTLTDLEGRVLTVESQRDTGWTAPVYNIEVHEHHTYHVGALGVWVHNANCCDVKNQPVVDPTKRGVISNTKLAGNRISLDMTAEQQAMALDIAKNGDPNGTKTEYLVNSVAQSQSGQVLGGGKYGSNNGFDHVIAWADAEGNVNLTLLADSKQVGGRGVALDPKAAGAQMQMSAEWDEAVLRRLPDDSPAKQAILAAKENGTLVKAVAYVDKNTGTLNLVRIDPKAPQVNPPAIPEPPKDP